MSAPPPWAPPEARGARPLRLIALAVANVVFSFLFQWYVIAALGAGRPTDALFTAMIVPQLVLAVTGASLAGVLVPLLSAAADHPGQSAWTVMHAVAGAATLIAAALFATAPAWTPLLAPGFDEEATALTGLLIRIQLLGVPLSALASVLWSVGYSRNRFIWAESAQAASTAMALVALVWVLPSHGSVGAAWVIVLRVLLQTAILFPLIGAYHRPEWRAPVLWHAWRRIRPLLLGSTYYKADELVDRFLTSMAPAGGLTLLYLAQRLWGAGQAVLSRALIAPLTPRLARLANAREWATLQRLIFHRAALLVVLLAGAGIAAGVGGIWGLELIFRGSHLASGDVRMLWWILIALLGMWAGGVLGELLAAGFYATGNTSTPTRIGVLGFTVGIGLKFGGFLLWGVLGVALGTSAYYLLNALLLALLLASDLRQRQGAGVALEMAAP